jgi:hypothetical protein
MSKHKSEDYKIITVKYYLENDTNKDKDKQDKEIKLKKNKIKEKSD